jgi:hypothetical protein
MRDKKLFKPIMDLFSNSTFMKLAPNGCLGIHLRLTLHYTVGASLFANQLKDHPAAMITSTRQELFFALIGRFLLAISLRFFQSICSRICFAAPPTNLAWLSELIL